MMRNREADQDPDLGQYVVCQARCRFTLCQHAFHVRPRHLGNQPTTDILLLGPLLNDAPVVVLRGLLEVFIARTDEVLAYQPIESSGRTTFTLYMILRSAFEGLLVSGHEFGGSRRSWKLN